MNETCNQQRRFNENGSKKVTCTQNQNETDDISRTYNEERGPGEFDIQKRQRSKEKQRAIDLTILCKWIAEPGLGRIVRGDILIKDRTL